MTYPEVIERLGIEHVCLGGCGLGAHRHRGSIFLGVIHWRDRRVTRRGLRRFLLLVVKRKRLADPEYLNDRYLTYFHIWDDEHEAAALAGELGIRFPVEFSRTERLRCLALASKRKSHSILREAILEWAKRGVA